MRTRAVRDGMQGGSRALQMLVHPSPQPPLPPEMRWWLLFPDLKEMSSYLSLLFLFHSFWRAFKELCQREVLLSWV